jgi:hypothetical protein
MKRRALTLPHRKLSPHFPPSNKDTGVEKASGSISRNE